MTRLQRRENGPYFAAFSLRIPDMRNFFDVHEIVKIWPRALRVLIEPMFRFRTPKPDRLLARIFHERGHVFHVIAKRINLQESLLDIGALGRFVPIRLQEKYGVTA